MSLLLLWLRPASRCRLAELAALRVTAARYVSVPAAVGIRCSSGLSAAGLVGSAPSAVQPYLKLMRLDKPIGKSIGMFRRLGVFGDGEVGAGGCKLSAETARLSQLGLGWIGSWDWH
eukprot:g34322.t1